MYNTTYRITVDNLEEPVILRIAPAPGQQYTSERELMRNEYTTVPYVSPIADLVPRFLLADWSQEITGRDWIVQSHLTGVPAPRPSRRLPPRLVAGLLRPTRRDHVSHSRHPRPGLRPGHGSQKPHLERGLDRLPARHR
ncbi:hypothetical protein ACFY2M_38495 [Streptomyces sp. NPDC001276]|uniref:hypothetical protein n=1 Tax=Streptomyces sp. NPDC001276 TaxID=3364555 RepID=UPI0036AD65F6